MIDFKHNAEKQLRQAVKTMKEHMDNAQRILNGDGSIEYKTGAVVHELAWGNANASGGVERAVAWIETGREIAEAENEETVNPADCQGPT